MKRVITSLSLLLLLLCGAYAQDVSQYEYWTDDDYASRSVVNSSGGNVSIDVSTSSLSAGIHFLNFRAKADNGTWGNFYRYMYYIPSLRVDGSGSLSLEYWLDDVYEGRKNTGVDNDNVSLTLDISQLKAGVHFFNCTPISATSGRGNSERYMFYVPMSFSQATVAAVTGYEYWFDDNYSAVVKKQAGAGEQLLSLSLEGLASGVHYFNCRAVNERGEYGSPIREMFYIPQTEVNANAQIAKSEYWLDDDYSNRTTLTAPNTEHAFTIDISALSSGVHYFNYRAVDNKGVWGNTIRQAFYIAIADNLPAIGKISYEYWLNDDTAHKVTGEGTSSEYIFNIDISSLDEGSHTFNFRAKDPLDQWGDTFVSSFVIDYSIPYLLGDVNCDGKVDAADIVMLVKYINDEDLPSTCDINKADMNKNGRVNSVDFDLLVKAIMGIKETE